MSDRFDLVVLGGGPGGYSAAFRAADLGLRTLLVERDERLGGVCLNVGCIPSKALLHAAALIDEAAHAPAIGLTFGAPQIDLDTLRASTERVVATLAKGLGGLAGKRRVEIVTGRGRLTSATTLDVDGDAGLRQFSFAHAILATGSRPATIPGGAEDPRIIDSTGALALEDIPPHLVVVGGGIIGLEMATVYRALGSQVTIVEMLDELLTGCDRDLVAPLAKRLTAGGVTVHLGTKVSVVDTGEQRLRIGLDGADGTNTQLAADRMLVAIGRRPNTDAIGLGAAGIELDAHGFIPVDHQMRTRTPSILAVGDIVGNPMLAHKASHQGRVAAEVAAGQDVRFEAATIPSVAYTDPEVAWMGLTETEARLHQIPHEVASIPWAASGRAMTLGRTEGRTKLITDPTDHRILGAGIVGPQAGELIGELVLAREMGAVAQDLALTIHPHPTLSETVALAAEWAEGTITDLYRPAGR